MRVVRNAIFLLFCNSSAPLALLRAAVCRRVHRNKPVWRGQRVRRPEVQLASRIPLTPTLL